MKFKQFTAVYNIIPPRANLQHPWVKPTCNYMLTQVFTAHKSALNGCHLAKQCHKFVITVKDTKPSELSLFVTSHRDKTARCLHVAFEG